MRKAPVLEQAGQRHGKLGAALGLGRQQRTGRTGPNGILSEGRAELDWRKSGHRDPLPIRLRQLQVSSSCGKKSTLPFLGMSDPGVGGEYE
jgi:hypothetical protein